MTLNNSRFSRTKPAKPRTCPECGAKYVKTRNVQPTCGALPCQESYALKVAHKAAWKREKMQRAADRAQRETLKTRSQWVKDAQIAFNRYVRARDEKQTCICCGNPLSSGSVGGDYDCGHYRSVGSAPHLRFDERNAHAQRKQCNRWGAGRAVDYRIGLIRRLGLAAVESLESDQEPKHYSIEDLKAIKALYVAKIKELRNAA